MGADCASDSCAASEGGLSPILIKIKLQKEKETYVNFFCALHHRNYSVGVCSV